MTVRKKPPGIDSATTDDVERDVGRDRPTLVPRDEGASASWWRTTVSNESWRCQPIATTPTDASTITASGANRRSENLGQAAPAAEDGGPLLTVMVDLRA